MFEEPASDDAGSDFFRRAGNRKADQKARQLCRQVYRTLSVALTGCGDEVLQDLTVVSVDPAPDAGHLLVTVSAGPPIGGGAGTLPDILDRLGRATGRLRSEVARDIVRKRAPGLAFRVLPRGGEPMTSPPSQTPPAVRRWLAGPLPPDVSAALDRLAQTDDVRRIAVMPDVHLAADVCVGTVLATSRLIYPAAVGGDIGCGMLAVAFDCGADVLATEAAAGRLFERLYAAVPANRHRKPRDLPPALADRPLSDPRLDAVVRRDGRVQFGTLGRGNHFLEFQTDEADGRMWLAVHSGSRAVGRAVHDLHVRRADAGRGGLVSLNADGPAGRAYLVDAEWARAYADANRRAMANEAAAAVRDLFSAGVVDKSLIACDHNHVRRETHFSEPVWVHRKGAMPAAAGEPGVLPGSMGTATYHVEGRGDPASLRSSAHGAGRAMSRERARANVSERDLRRQLAGVWFDPRMAGRLRDEAPAAYKDVAAVLRAQRDLVRVVRRLKPVLVYKGS